MLKPDEIREILKVAAEFNLNKFKLGDLEVEFSPALYRGPPMNLDDSEERLERVRADLRELSREQNEDMFWSADLPRTQES